MELGQQQARGHIAEQLMTNTVLKDALKAIKDEVSQQWLDCPARDEKGKEALWQLAKTAQKFENILIGYIETGKLATERIKQYEKKDGLIDRIRRIA